MNKIRFISNSRVSNKILILTANAQQCKIIEAFLLAGFYNVAYQQPNGFCNEWVIGPIVSAQVE